MALKINISSEVGFCSGVKSALKKAADATARYQSVAMLGDIVHNEIVIQDLAQKGVSVIDALDKVAKKTPILFRSHGTPIAVWEKARELGLTIIDATCPLVREIHRIVKELDREGRQVIILGDKSHEEVEAIASQVKNAVVISSVAEVCNTSFAKKVGIVVQSTLNLETATAIVAEILERSEDLRFVNTICRPTRKRQKQIRELAAANDVMIIVGSRSSANTNRLTQIARAINPRTHLVSDESELHNEWFQNVGSVGVASGASTPQTVVQKVVEKLSAIP